jgi:dTDP-4-dehydrorhamnose reductase
LSGGEDRSYADLAARLGERLGVPSDLVRPIAADPVRHPPAARPRHSSLDMSLEAERFGLRQPAFDEVADGLIR